MLLVRETHLIHFSALAGSHVPLHGWDLVGRHTFHWGVVTCGTVVLLVDHEGLVATKSDIAGFACCLVWVIVTFH